MKTIISSVFLLFLCSCGKGPESSIEIITTESQQEALFKDLMTVIQHNVPNSLLGDSLSFLVLPVQASCPACRKKTIDSIVKHQSDLVDKHYIIVSASGGRKTIKGYFQEQGYELPVIPGHFFIDSTNLAYKNDLYKDKPTIYYVYNKKAYKKVSAIPATVREDLREFFSGHRKPAN